MTRTHLPFDVPLLLLVEAVFLGQLSFFQVNAQPFAFSPSFGFCGSGSKAGPTSLLVSAPGGLSSLLPGLALASALVICPPWPVFSFPILSVSPHHPAGLQGRSGPPARHTHPAVGSWRPWLGFASYSVLVTVFESNGGFS